MDSYNDKTDEVEHRCGDCRYYRSRDGGYWTYPTNWLTTGPLYHKACGVCTEGPCIWPVAEGQDSCQHYLSQYAVPWPLGCSPSLANLTQQVVEHA